MATFLGGALPWLEAVVVIPAGILGGLDPVVAVVSGVSGNLLTVAAAAYGGDRIIGAWRRWRRRRNPEAAPPDAEHRPSRAERVFRRYGMPALALLGPIAIGTQLSAITAVALGVSSTRAFAWVAAGTIGWGVAAGAGLAAF